MKLVLPNVKILNKGDELDYKTRMRRLERIGRVCYKSEDQIDEEDFNKTERFVQRLIKMEHESIIEHDYLSLRFVISIATSRELIRHRMSSFAEMSTRYCNFTKDKFDNDVKICVPFWAFNCLKEDEQNESFILWKNVVDRACEDYLNLVKMGMAPQFSRGVLPLDTATEIVVTANLRQWRHVFKMRTPLSAHPDIRYIMRRALDQCYDFMPIIFDDLC